LLLLLYCDRLLESSGQQSVLVHYSVVKNFSASVRWSSIHCSCSTYTFSHCTQEPDCTFYYKIIVSSVSWLQQSVTVTYIPL